MSEQTTIIDYLAHKQHAIWSHWMKYLFKQGHLDGDGGYVIPKDKVDRWVNLMNLDYPDLTELSKQSDRNVVNDLLLKPLDGEEMVNPVFRLSDILDAAIDGERIQNAVLPVFTMQCIRAIQFGKDISEPLTCAKWFLKPGETTVAGHTITVEIIRDHLIVKVSAIDNPAWITFRTSNSGDTALGIDDIHCDGFEPIHRFQDAIVEYVSQLKGTLGK